MEANNSAGMPAGTAFESQWEGHAFTSFVFATLRTTLSALYCVISFTSITLPSWLFALFSASLTVTMNATTLLLVFLAVLSCISWLVRYRYLNMYARLPPEPQRKEPTIDVFPEVSGDAKRGGLSNYLDEFLSAIKVFGYLERSVFHELTRTMQTRKLVAGETILLEDEQGFCLVVDGLVQIFVKSTKDRQSESTPEDGSNADDDDDENEPRVDQGYQLLTEVKNGAPMSSLFSILSLFTEDVKLRYDEDEDDRRSPLDSYDYQGRHPSMQSTFGSVTPISAAQSPNPMPSGSPSLIDAKYADSSARLPSVPPLSLDGSLRAPGAGNARKLSRTPLKDLRNKKESAHPDILARAAVDTTIAIIPATAFRRLTRMYPRASAHIVQVILTRLQRVTLTTGHAYLGLTSEVLRTEKLMNRYTTYDLPGYLKGSALERLKEKFSKEKEKIGPDEYPKGIALHNPSAHRRRRSSTTLRKEAVTHARLSAAQTSAASRSRKLSPENERSGVSAGDLLVNSQRPRSAASSVASSVNISSPVHTNTRPDNSRRVSKNYFNAPRMTRLTLHRQESIDEDSFFRDSITGCMLKAIGLTNASNGLPKPESVEQSPRLVSYDAKSHKAVFNNAFGFMDAFDPSADGDTDSVVSVPASTASTSGTSIQDQLSGDIEIVFFPKGAVLVEQGERNPGLYYVIDGFLDITVPVEDSTSGKINDVNQSNNISTSALGLSMQSNNNKDDSENPRRSLSGETTSRKDRQTRSLYLTKPGGLAGYLGTISSRRSFVDVTAKTDVFVGFLPRASIERILEKYPIVLLTMAKRLTSLLPRLIRHIDFALEWVQVDAGQAVFHQGDDSDAIYIVLNGRLRTHQEGSDGKMQPTGEYGQGDSIGELEVLTESKRAATLKAIRDTELAKLPKTLFNSIALENPEITIKMSKIIATRMRNLMESSRLESTKPRATKTVEGVASSTTNLRTIGIVPVTAGVPVVEFSSRLYSALSQIGTPNGVTLLNQAAILNHLGRNAFNKMGKLLLSQHLADLEEKYGLVLYVADTSVNSPWTNTCITQADCILLVGTAEGSSGIGEFERYLVTTKTTVRKELVLLHSERYCPQGLTRKWLRDRIWINGSHHHIHMAYRNPTEPVHPQIRRFGSTLKQRVQVIQAEIQKYTSRKVRETPLYSADTPFKGDFHRLARRLLGKSVGLVLGGGGARGIAQIGVIRALEEAGMPIDIVGGTSIGAFVGALYAWDADVVPMYGRAKKFAGRMGSMWRFALDLTYPTVSYTTGHEFNRGIFKTFGTAQIEDFWLEYYCNTCNISKSRQEIHTSGYVWRYVRASMSLAGLVPPICDEDGCMLVDGGYLDNLTVEHMKSLGVDVIFAIDVGADDDQTPQRYGDSLSGFWSVLNRWNPFSIHVNPPTLSEIQGRLAYVSSVDALERAKTLPGCNYMRPPIQKYGTLEFGKFDEIYQKGYEYGRQYLEDLRKRGVLPAISPGSGGAKEVRRTMAPRRASI